MESNSTQKRKNSRIALLRAVNVGGNNLASMASLKALFAFLGFPGAQSLLQSGNLVFAGDGRSKLNPGVIEKKLGLLGTGRNWNTGMKLLAMVE